MQLLLLLLFATTILPSVRAVSLCGAGDYTINAGGSYDLTGCTRTGNIIVQGPLTGLQLTISSGAMLRGRLAFFDGISASTITVTSSTISNVGSYSADGTFVAVFLSRATFTSTALRFSRSTLVATALGVESTAGVWIDMVLRSKYRTCVRRCAGLG